MATSNPQRWVVIVSHNNLDLLRAAITSVERQDVPVSLMVVDNESAGDVRAFLHSKPGVVSVFFNPQHSIAKAWNTALQYLFTDREAERVLVLNSDVVLRGDTYRWLETERAPFVTGVGVHTPEQVGEPRSPNPQLTRPHPDFSCFMISRDCYEYVGPFDECFRPAWFEDNSYHVRMHRAGIQAYSIDLPFLHVGGGAQTLKRAGIEESLALSAAFEGNRQQFIAMYGCDPADMKEYEKLFEK
jgi:GT2 family glycosyltransferase